MNTHREDKREMLKNALLNVALRTDLDEEEIQIFFQIIEAITATGVRLLSLLRNDIQLQFEQAVDAVILNSEVVGNEQTS
jgi:hypothetical protein